MLREIVNLAPEDQVEIVRQIIQFSLTRNQIKTLISGHDEDNAKEKESTLSRHVIQLARLMQPEHLPDAYTLATALIDQEKDPVVAKARVQMLRKILDDAEAYLTQ